MLVLNELKLVGVLSESESVVGMVLLMLLVVLVVSGSSYTLWL